MHDKKGMGHGSLDDNNKRWSPENMGEKKRLATEVWIIIKRDDTLRIWQCCGSGMFIPDPNFVHPGSRIKKIPAPGSGSASKNLSIFDPKNWF